MAGKNLTRSDENAISTAAVLTRSKAAANNIEAAKLNVTNGALADAKAAYLSSNHTSNIPVTRSRRSALTNLNSNVSQIPTTISSNLAAKTSSSARVSTSTTNNNINSNNANGNGTTKDQRVSGSRASLQPTSRKDRQVQIKKDQESATHNVSSNDEDQKYRRDGTLIQTTQPQSLKRSASEAITHQTEKRIKIEYTWDDLDEEDIDDPVMVSEYVVEIFEYLQELEKKTLPDPTYLSWQPSLQPRMRSILVDWIVEIHLRFRLLPETLFLAINLMDRFLSIEEVQVEKVQLLATSCLFIASKYEEVFSPSVKNYAIVTDGGYTEEEILDAEKAVVETLEFNMSYPNPMNFLRRISKADDYEVRTRTLGKYLLEISIVDHNFIGVLPSLAAAAAMYVARKILDRGIWNSNLIHYSGGYTEHDMADVCEMIVKYLVSPIVHEEFFKKYASRKFMKASIVARHWAKLLIAEGKSVMDYRS